MNPQASTPGSTGITPVATRDEKCRHFTARGRQCRLPVLRSGLCFRHAALQLQPAQPLDVDLSADFLIKLDDLRSADQINQFLAKLLILVVQNRISARRAAVLAYITNQLLRTLPAIDRELNPKEDPNAPVEIICDMPGPEDDRVHVAEPTYADVRT
jgi:hypothetical protein